MLGPSSHRLCTNLPPQACQPREGGASSLIKVYIASHPASEERPDGRIPAGLEYWSVDVDITQLEVVFLYRFLQVRRLAHLFFCLLPGHSASRPSGRDRSMNDAAAPTRARDLMPGSGRGTNYSGSAGQASEGTLELYSQFTNGHDF